MPGLSPPARSAADAHARQRPAEHAHRRGQHRPRRGPLRPAFLRVRRRRRRPAAKHARLANCQAPADGWISYIEGNTNIPHCSGDPLSCVPAFDWLYAIEDYVAFFSALKPSSEQVHMLAIAGPVTPVVVGKDGPNPVLKPSCQSGQGFATPALRIDALLRAFGGELAPLCDADYSPAFERLGGQVASALMATTWRDGQPSGGFCGDTCLDKVACEAADVPLNPAEKTVPIAKCPRTLFLQPELAKHECGDSCPCWRVVPRAACAARANVSPFAFEVMRKARASFGLRTQASCRVSTKPWDDPSVQQAALHCVAR